MKTVGASLTIGIILALILIYYLWPLNLGAAGLITVLAIGVVSLFVRLISMVSKSRFGRGNKS